MGIELGPRVSRAAEQLGATSQDLHAYFLEPLTRIERILNRERIPWDINLEHLYHVESIRSADHLAGFQRFYQRRGRRAERTVGKVKTDLRIEGDHVKEATFTEMQTDSGQIREVQSHKVEYYKHSYLNTKNELVIEERFKRQELVNQSPTIWSSAIIRTTYQAGGSQRVETTLNGYNREKALVQVELEGDDIHHMKLKQSKEDTAV